MIELSNGKMVNAVKDFADRMEGYVSDRIGFEITSLQKYNDYYVVRLMPYSKTVGEELTEQDRVYIIKEIISRAISSWTGVVYNVFSIYKWNDDDWEIKVNVEEKNEEENY